MRYRRARTVVHRHREGGNMAPRPSLAKITTVALLTMIITVGAPIVALAAAPTNDNFANAQLLAFGDEVAIDTSEATTEALDREAGDACPFPPGPPPSTVNTVWFEFTADATTPETAAVFVDGAFWAAGVAIVTGAPGSFAGVACGPMLAVFSPEAGTTYRIMIFDFADSGGGTAVVRLGEVPPPPELGLTIDPTGQFNSKTGTATVSGTYECSNASFVSVFGQVTQSVGRFKITGSFSTFDVRCDGEVHPWSAEVTAFNGEFRGGKALTVAMGFSCGVMFCTQALVEQTIQLNGR
jgi:ribosomal protein S8E